MRVDRIDVDRPGDRQRYDALFETCPWAVVQQSGPWCDVIRGLGPDRPTFLVCSEGGRDLAGLPLYLFDGRHGSILTSVPQAGPLGGVFARDELGPEERDAARRLLLEEALALARELGCIALSSITSPFASDLAGYVESLEPTYVFENFTQVLPLVDRPRPSGGQRNNLARARRFGFRVERTADADTQRQWYELHRRRHREIGATPLPRSLIENVFEHLVPVGKAALFTAWDGDRLAAGCLYCLHRKVIDVYAISMDSDYAAHSPNALLADASMRWAAEAGVEVYNWQSSISRSSGVYRSKQLWGSREALYYFVTRLLVEPESIAALGPDAIREGYAGHYLVPFAAFAGGLAPGRYRKE